MVDVVMLLEIWPYFWIPSVRRTEKRADARTENKPSVKNERTQAQDGKQSATTFSPDKSTISTSNLFAEYLVDRMASNKGFEGDAGAPLPDFSTGQIRLDTVAPALGVGSTQQPDYLDYDQKGRGLVVTMFANAGVSYLLGIVGGGVYGFQKGISSTPSSKFKVQVNSVLNHCGRYGSKAGNSMGVFAVMYSLYEGIFDQVSYRRIVSSMPSS
jgi:Tim17/Tim22/Tim23/Pmp24 family